MALNFSSVISNAKGAANIAKIKVNLSLKTNELNREYAELGKYFFDCTNDNQTKDGESVSNDMPCLEIENMNSSPIDCMSNKKVCNFLKNIHLLKQEIATLEAQVLSEKDNMQPIEILKDPMPWENNQTNYSANPAEQTEPGIKCPKCEMAQNHDNEFCVYCGTKIKE